MGTDPFSFSFLLQVYRQSGKAGAGGGRQVEEYSKIHRDRDPSGQGRKGQQGTRGRTSNWHTTAARQTSKKLALRKEQVVCRER